MSSRRLLKAAEAIREVVAGAILKDLRDPRVRDVTVIGVEVSPDMREAKVAVSVMGDESQKTLSVRGLQNSAGFLQSKIANRLDTRYTPRLRFELDRGQEHAMAVGDILAKIARERKELEEGITDPEFSDSEFSDSEFSDSEFSDSEFSDSESSDSESSDSESSDPESADPTETKPALPNTTTPENESSDRS